MKRFRIITRICAKTKRADNGVTIVSPVRRWVVQQKGWWFWSDVTHYAVAGHHNVEIVEGAEYPSLKKAEEQVAYLTRLYQPDTVVKEYDVFDVVKQKRVENQ